MTLDSCRNYTTPLYHAVHHGPLGRVFVTLQGQKTYESTMERIAHVHLIGSGHLQSGLRLLASFADNPGFSQDAGNDFLCLIAPPIPPAQTKRVDAHQIRTYKC